MRAAFFQAIEPFWSVVDDPRDLAIGLPVSDSVSFPLNLVSGAGCVPWHFTPSQKCRSTPSRTPRQSRTSALTAPRVLRTAPTWPNIYASIQELSPTPAATARKPSANSHIYNSTHGKVQWDWGGIHDACCQHPSMRQVPMGRLLRASRPFPASWSMLILCREQRGLLMCAVRSFAKEQSVRKWRGLLGRQRQEFFPCLGDWNL